MPWPESEPLKRCSKPGLRSFSFGTKDSSRAESSKQRNESLNYAVAAGALFIVNDRADIAKLLDAGLHLGQDDLTPKDARRILSGENIIGFSTHNEQQLRAGDLEPVDYLAIGPIFATTSKQNPDPVVGLDRLRALRTLTKKPLVAIGGITLESAPQVFEAGADSVAIISGLRARAEDWIAICQSRR